MPLARTASLPAVWVSNLQSVHAVRTPRSERMQEGPEASRRGVQGAGERRRTCRELEVPSKHAKPFEMWSCWAAQGKLETENKARSSRALEAVGNHLGLDLGLRAVEASKHKRHRLSDLLFREVTPEAEKGTDWNEQGSKQADLTKTAGSGSWGKEGNAWLRGRTYVTCCPVGDGEK